MYQIVENKCIIDCSQALHIIINVNHIVNPYKQIRKPKTMTTIHTHTHTSFARVYNTSHHHTHTTHYFHTNVLCGGEPWNATQRRRHNASIHRSPLLVVCERSGRVNRRRSPQWKRRSRLDVNLFPTQHIVPNIRPLDDST